jgi:hypothetical protein
MNRKLLCAGVLSVVMLGCVHKNEPQPVPEPAASAAAVAPVKSQEVAMSDVPDRGVSSDPATQPAPASQPRQTAFTGTLRGRVMAAGGETTGWRLERDDGTRVDVNVAKVRDSLDGLDGKRVVIHGAITTANWVERGRRELIIAERVEPAGDKQ